MEQLLVYIVFFLIVFFINCMGLRLYKKEQKRKFGLVLFLFSFALLLMFIGFRYNVGTDYESYLITYNRIKILSFNELYKYDWEFGAVLLFKLVSLFFKNNFILFFFIGAFQLYPIYKINKLNKFEFLPYSVLIFCFVFLPFYLNGMRQGIAISFALLSFYYLHDKNNNIKSILYLTLGYMFHKSILIIIPYLILSLISNKKRYKKLSIIITIIISIIILFFFKEIAESYDFSDYNYIIQSIDSNKISFAIILLYIPKILLLLFLKSKDLLYNSYSGLYINGIIYDVIGTSVRFLSRISLYFVIFEIILFPYLIQNIKEKKSRLIIKFLYILYLIIYFIYWFYFMRKQGIFPYNTWVF